MRFAVLIAMILGVAQSAHAQEGGQTDEMKRALAAGYKAAFTCSAIFNAGQTAEEIAANELTGIYPDYREVFADLPEAKIDRINTVVTVEWSDTLAPRAAIYGGTMRGCYQAPIGGEADALIAQKRGLVQRIPRERTIVINPGADPEGLSVPVALGSVVTSAFDSETYGETTRTSGVLVVRNGLVLAEDYALGIDAQTPQRTWSVAKSISATVIGAAVHQGILNVEDFAGLAEWQNSGDPRKTITLENLLHMASGLDSGASGSRTDQIYFGGGRVEDHALNRSLEVTPGTRFKYANNDTLLAMRVLREKLDSDGANADFPYRHVLHPIGALRTVLETDWSENYLSSSQVWTTARDLARIGQLYLNDGVWGDERIMPEGWTDYVRAEKGPQPSQGGWGYGAQFWTMGGIDGLPGDAFVAAGHRGQYLVIIPSLDLVIVRRGYDASGGTRFEITRFAADVVQALSAP